MKTDEEEKKRHFMNALSNYIPVLETVDGFDDRGAEEFPAGWTDPLQLYGQYLEELKAQDCDMEEERRELLWLLNRKTPEWVWENRIRLVGERIFLLHF